MQAVIFTEAGSNFGLGHLSRCFAFKNYLLDCQFECIIYNRGDFKSKECVPYNWLEDDISHIVTKSTLVIVDTYYANFEFCSALVAMSKLCIFFDDYNRMTYPNEAIVLNGALNAQRLYKNITKNMFIGIEYCLLRKEFQTKTNKKINKEVSKILVTLGANDMVNNTQKVLDILEKEADYAFIDVVIGNKYKPISYGFNTTIHSGLEANTLRNLMLDCDIAISGGGVTMVELQATHTPTIALQVASNQTYQLRSWRDVGLRVAENTHQIEFLLKTLRKFKDRKKLSNRLSKIEIGTRAKHFINHIVEQYHK